MYFSYFSWEMIPQTSKIYCEEGFLMLILNVLFIKIIPFFLVIMTTVTKLSKHLTSAPKTWVWALFQTHTHYRVCPVCTSTIVTQWVIRFSWTSALFTTYNNSFLSLHCLTSSEGYGNHLPLNIMMSRAGKPEGAADQNKAAASKGSIFPAI